MKEIKKFNLYFCILREEFDIPNELTPILLMPLGYKAEDCPMNPLHDKRKSIEDIVEYK